MAYLFICGIQSASRLLFIVWNFNEDPGTTEVTEIYTLISMGNAEATSGVSSTSGDFRQFALIQ